VVASLGHERIVDVFGALEDGQHTKARMGEKGHLIVTMTAILFKM
jgi:hypothetical protein